MKLTKQRLKEIIKEELNEARKPDMDEKQFKAIRKQLTKVRDEMVKSIKMEEIDLIFLVRKEKEEILHS